MKQQYLDAGQIVSTHGIRGEVKVLPWADGPEFLTLFDRVYLKGREYVLESARVQKTCVLLKLQGVDTVEAAQTLRDTVVQVDREDVELEEGTYFIADLIGLRVLEGEREIGVIRGDPDHARQRCVCGPGGAHLYDSGGKGNSCWRRTRIGLCPGQAH